MGNKTIWMVAATVLLLFQASCKEDRSQTKWTYMPDMMDGPTVKPQQDYLDPPQGSIARETLVYPKNSAEAEQALRNPLAGKPGEDTHRAKGKELYETYCTVCHGPDAKGGGTIVDKYPRPPDITMEAYSKRKDGFYFHTITFGSPSTLMPKYGHATSVDERWKIVLYLRSLQAQAAR